VQPNVDFESIKLLMFIERRDFAVIFFSIFLKVYCDFADF